MPGGATSFWTLGMITVVTDVVFLYAWWRDFVLDGCDDVNTPEIMFLYAWRRDFVLDATPGGGHPVLQRQVSIRLAA